MNTLVFILTLLLAVTNGRDWQFGSTTLDTKTFANLGTENDGQVKWCPDCQSTNPCLAAGTGAFAFGQHGGWNCAAASGVVGPTGPTGPASPPSGTAGGDLSGTYPNPTVVSSSGVPFSIMATTGGVSDLTNGNGTSFALVAGQIPVVRDATSTDPIIVVGPCAAGTVVKGTGGIPACAGPPFHFFGGANVVVSTASENVIPLQGVDAPVATSAEGAVSIDADSAFNTNALVCVGLNATGVVTSPSPGTYTACLRKNGVNTTQCCTLSGAAACTNSTSQTILSGNLVDIDVTPSATAPTALIIKCSLSGK